jgi:predicted AAA+ superfamily ATPase
VGNKEKVIVRQKYLDKVRPFIGKQIIKVFTGQRRVGKSYLLKQLINYIRKEDKSANILYINKEELRFDAIKNAQDLNSYVLSQTKKKVMNYVFVDEIQEIIDFEKAMRSLLLCPYCDLYCTGSNADIVSGELATMLSGRCIEIPVYSLSFNEFLLFHRLENTNGALHKYLKYGGMPYLKNLELTDNIVFDYLKGVYNTVVYRDVVRRYDIRNTAFLENLTVFLADNISHIFSAKKIENYLRSQKINIAASQIINYLNHLSGAYIVHRVKRMDVVGKKIFEIGEKFYFEDLGIRNTILEYKQADMAKIIENAVFNHLMYHNYSVWAGQENKNEIDFVARRNGETLYIQVCYLLQEQKTIEREFGNLEKIRDNYPKTVVSMDEFSGNSRNGIHHKYLRDFLTECS